MVDKANHRPRRAIGAAAGIAFTRLGTIETAKTQAVKATPTRPPAIVPGASASFGPLKQVDAGVLDIGYAETGPAYGPAVVLLHGWPNDIYTYVDVAPLLASAGHRVVVPYLRGHGTTRFLSADTPPIDHPFSRRTPCSPAARSFPASSPPPPSPGDCCRRSGAPRNPNTGRRRWSSRGSTVG